MAAGLRALVADQHPAPAVRHLALASGGGRSRDNWSFDLRRGDASSEPMILRLDPDGGLVETDRAAEFRLLRALETSTVPTPAVHWLDADGSIFGRPGLVMERKPGRADYHVLNGDLPLESRLELAAGFTGLLVEVHGVDWRASGWADAVDDPGPEAAAAELDRWCAVLRRDQLEPYPELAVAAAALGATAPSAPERVLVHGDFKPGNILLDGGRISALLDWELAHVGDPMEDLGWMTQPLRRREHVIAGAWEDEDLLRCYEQASGRKVDEPSVRWWGMFATFRTAVMQVTGLRSYIEGRSPEPYRPTRKVLASLLDAVGS